MKDYKLNITRPEFLLNLMTAGNIDELSIDNMKLSLCDTTPLCYCTYTVLMEANINQDDIEAMYNDGESIAITFRKKSDANMIKERCNKNRVRYGLNTYKVKLKTRDRHLIAEVKKVESDSDMDE